MVHFARRYGKELVRLVVLATITAGVFIGSMSIIISCCAPKEETMYKQVYTYKVYSSNGTLLQTIECANCEVFSENDGTTVLVDKNTSNWEPIVSTSGTIIKER